MQFRILYQDEALVVIDKPAGVSVHPAAGRSLDSEYNVVKDLRNQLGKWVYPVHRLDRSTSGVLILAFSGEVASLLQDQFKAHEVNKFYLALVRGWLPEKGSINSPLTKRLDGGTEVQALTQYESIFQFELPHSLGVHASARFSLLGVAPETGRLHQIRRHFKRIAHPLIGDTVHGDGKNNQLWRTLTGKKALYLKAYSLNFTHPLTHKSLYFYSNWNATWHQVFDLAGFCPLTQKKKDP